MIKLMDLLLEHPDMVRDSDNWVADSLHSDSRTFILDPDSDFWIMGKGEKWFHDNIVSTLTLVYNQNDGDKTLISDVLNDMVVYDSNLSMSKDLSRISDFIKEHLNDEQGEMHEAKGSRMFGITGRVWLDKKIISFWQELKVVKENLRVVDGFIRDAVKIAPDQLKFDFVDKLNESPLYTFKDLLKGVEHQKNEKYKELLKIQHLDPNAKKELEKMKPTSSDGVGAKKYAGAAQKAGFKSPAEFNYAHQLDEDRLNEDPDDVFVINNKMGVPMPVASFHHKDAKTFIIDTDSDFWILGNSTGSGNVFHGRLWGFLLEAFEGSNGSVDTFKKNIEVLKKKMKLTTSFDIEGGFNFIQKHTKDSSDNSMMGRKVGLSGRLWTDKSIVSFWKLQRDVAPHMKKVSNFLKSYTGLKDSDFKFDFPDREDEEPLFSYDDIINPKSNIKSNSVDKLSDEDYELLLKLQHIDPQAKKKLSGDGTSQKIGASKYSDIAKKAGYDSVSKFNYDRKIDEMLDRPIKLKDLLENCVYESNTVSTEQRSYFDKFVEYVKKFLSIKGHYPVYIVDQNEVPTTTAYFDPESEVVKVAVKGRALPDCLRSLGHEFVHAKQHEMGELHEKSGQTGSKQENQANSLAGIMMRNFSKECPEIYNSTDK